MALETTMTTTLGWRSSSWGTLSVLILSWVVVTSVGTWQLSQVIVIVGVVYLLYKKKL